MIKGLVGDSYIVVAGGDTAVPYVSQNTNNPIQGMIRINGNIMETFDGSRWITMNTSYATVMLKPEYSVVLEWAAKKMQQEKEIQALAEQYPAIADLADAVKIAEEKLHITNRTCKIQIQKLEDENAKLRKCQLKIYNQVVNAEENDTDDNCVRSYLVEK